jgi:hypothetical protein
LEIRDKNGDIAKAELEIKYRRIKVLPSKDKQKKYPALTLTVIHVKERKQPRNRERIVWKLITDLTISSKKEAIEKINCYGMRWKIEVFH